MAHLGHAVHSDMPSTLMEAKQLPEAWLVIARHGYAIDHSPGHRRISKPLIHVCDCRRVVRDLDDFVTNVVTREQGPYLPAKGAPIGLVQNNALATTRCFSRSRNKTKQRGGYYCTPHGSRWALRPQGTVRDIVIALHYSKPKFS